MTRRTRLFLLIASGVLVAGFGTGLVASYMGQGLVVIGGDGPDELSYVPADARAVAFADVRQIMDSELRQRILQFHNDNDRRDDADRFREETGIDIERDVDRVIAAFSGNPDQGRPLVLARGVFDEDWIETLIRQRGGQVGDYNGHRLLMHDDGELTVAFVEPGLAAVGPADAVRAAIDARQSGNNVLDNEELMRLVRDSDDGNAWAVARFDALTGSDRLPAELAQQLPAITWFSATGSVNGGIHGVVRAEARDEAAAQDLRQVVQGFVALARMQTRQRPELTQLLGSMQLGGTGRTVSLAFSLPTELIDALGLSRENPASNPGPGAAAPPQEPAPPAL